MRRKKTFVLLEILIGFALVSTLILPFLRYPYAHMKNEIDELFQMQLTRYAQERLCKIERDIYQNKLDPDFLFNTKVKVHSLRPVKQTVKLPFGWKRDYVEKVKIEWTAQKQSSEALFSLIHIHLSYEAKKETVASFHTELIAQKKL